MATFAESSRSPWKEVARVTQSAAVFLDGGAAEQLHWAGGVRLLGECVGVYDIYQELSPVARDFIAMAPYCHVVFVVTTFLHGQCSERIANLLSTLQPLECHVFSAMPEGMHAEWVPMPGEGVEEGTYSHYGEFQALMRKWINRESGVRVSVNHAPLFHCEVCPGLVITPPHQTLFPLLPSDIDNIQAKLIEEGETDYSLEHLGQVDLPMLTHELQTRIKSFSWALSDLLGQLDVREDIFSVGHTSRLIANQLATLPHAKSRRKLASSRCSLLLVDRTLDLSGPTSHSLDSLVDRVIGSLPHLSQHSNDVAVEMTPVNNTVPGVVLPGCLSQPQSSKAQTILRTLICSKQKESLMEVSRCLLDALSQEGLSARLSGKLGRPSATQLRGFLQQFKGHPDAVESQRAVIQLACAVVQVLEGEGSKHWEEMASIEKLLMMGASERDSDSVVKQLTEVTVKELVSPRFSLSELLGLAVCMYSMMGEDCADVPSEEKALKEALADLIIQHRDCDVEFIRALGIARSDSHTRVLGRLNSLFQILVGLGEARGQLRQLRDTFISQDQNPFSYHSLLGQLVDAIFHPSRPDLPDVEYHSHGLTDILKSGFSLFMSSARPRPSNHPLLLLFVVGGVSCTEVRQVREIVTNHRTDVQVVIGGTRLLTPNDITREVLCTEHLRLAVM